MSITSTKNRHILVTGATGYIGGRLVPRLLELGYQVRCLVRDPARLQGRLWQTDVEIMAGDVPVLLATNAIPTFSLMRHEI